MTRTRRPAKVRALADEVSYAFRAMIIGTVLIIIGTAGTSYWINQVHQPRFDRMSDALQAVERTHVAMIDTETSLLAYVSAREDRYLDPYSSARPILDEAAEVLSAESFDADLTRAIVHFQVALSTWYDDWALEALQLAFAAPTQQELAAFLEQGKLLFDDYRARAAVLEEALRGELDEARGRQRVALQTMLGLLVLVAAGTTLVTLRRRARLRRDVVEPVSKLRAAVESVADGDLAPPPQVTGPAEILDLREGLAQMAHSLSASRTAAVQRQQATDRLAARLLEVVEFARTVSGTLALDDVLFTVGSTIRRTTRARAVRVWLSEAGSDELLLAHDTRVGPDDVLPTDVRRLGAGLVGRSAQGGKVNREPSGPELTSAAFPLIVGARIAGVVEVVDAPCTPDELEELCQHVETLVNHAAAVIEAARLYQRSTEMSTRDALTGLANRRGFDEDLARETSLALRHARRLSFLMLDLDHFKQVNDTYGHQHGDQVLREVATVLLREARESEGVYRYGGEEFALLLSEAGSEAAFAVAERVRAAIEEHFRRTVSRQTVSIGVASMPEHATTADDLVAAADSALYEAKRAGRNRVVVHAGAATSAGREVSVSFDQG